MNQMRHYFHCVGIETLHLQILEYWELLAQEENPLHHRVRM
jgi:hypothetical protein